MSIKITFIGAGKLAAKAVHAPARDGRCGD